MSTQNADSTATNSAPPIPRPPIPPSWPTTEPAPKAPPRCYERARKVLPSGITHDARYLDPYSIHVARAKGPRKWDVDGNEYVDYFGGHGALLLGHSHPAIVEAVKRQMDLGTHYGSSHELEVRWAELVCELVPVGREGALHRLGHRGLAHGDPAGARVDRQGQDRALRRPLPRLARPCRGRRHLELRRLLAARRAAEHHRSLDPDADRRRRVRR